MSSRIASSIARLPIAPLDVVGVDVLHVRAVERRGHRADVAQRVGDRLDVLAGVEHPGPLGGDVGVVGERVPRAEHDVVELGDRREVLDHRAAVVGALAEADRVHQRERADRLGEAALHQLDAGDQGGGDRAEPDGQDAEAPVGRLHGGRRRCRHEGERTRSPATARAYSRPGDGDRDGRQRAARRARSAGLRERIAAAGSPPICLATVLVGDDPPSQRYVRSKQRKATEIGMQPRHVDLPGDGVAGPGRGGRRRAGGRPRRARHPRPAAAARAVSTPTR